jgi:hypothetical protein
MALMMKIVSVRDLTAVALLAVGFTLPGLAGAQELEIPPAVYPALPKGAASAQGFVPTGWALESQVSGDLTGDGVPDLALVLHEQNPNNVVGYGSLGENPFNTNPRILAVAFGLADDAGFSLALENHTLIPRRIDPTLEDPLAEGGVTVERATLRVTLGFFSSAGSWMMSRTTYVLRHQNSRFELIGFDRDIVQRSSGETTDVSVNYLTKRAKVTSGSIDSDRGTVVWKALSPGPLLTLEEIGDGIAFEPAT